MIDLEITFPEGEDNPLERLAAHLPRIMHHGLEAALGLGLDAARARLHGGGGPTSRTGFLEGSLAWEAWPEGDGASGCLFSDAPYAAVQEYGATIQARRAKYLKFQVQGRWVQVKQVTIPPRPFLEPGQEAAGLALEDCLAQAIEEDLS